MSEPAKPTTDIFLSYSSKDGSIARAVQEALAAAGYRVFWDQATPAGQDWDQWIRAQLAEAKLVVVLWSKTSLASANVRHEALISRDASKLLPVLIDDVKPSDLPMGLYLVQSLKLLGGPDQSPEGLAHLLSEVRARLGTSSAPPHAVSVPAAKTRQRLPSAAVGTAAAAALLLLGLGGRALLFAPSPAPVAAASANATTSPASTPPATLPANAAAAPSPPAPSAAPERATEAPPATASTDDALAPVQKVLTEYYADLAHVEDFEAKKYFALNVSHYLLWDNAKSRFALQDINRNARALAAYHPQLVPGSLQKSAAGTYSYIEKTRVTKDGKTKVYTALIAVDLNDHGKISRMQTVARRPL